MGHDVRAGLNEETAAAGGHRTTKRGAAGIIPAVLHYYRRFVGSFSDEPAWCGSLLTAGAIGLLFKENASISGAEVRLPGRGRFGLLDGRRRAR